MTQIGLTITVIAVLLTLLVLGFPIIISLGLASVVGVAADAAGKAEAKGLAPVARVVAGWVKGRGRWLWWR